VVKPFDTCYREPGEFSGRISRNIQIILKEESYFNRVADPAAGSYYIDSLTDALVEHAWQLFLKTSDQGGFIKAFTGGFIRDEVNKTASRRMEMVATKREVLLGTNHYPSFQEACAGLADPAVVFPEQVAAPEQVTEPLRITRAAVPFEKLRLAAENRPEGRPRVFMLTYGNLAMRLARSQFSSGFFAAAGYEITDNLGFASAEEGVEAALKVNADIIVVCSSDEEYPVIVPRVNELADGKAIVVVAGAPACMEELQQKGIREFIHMRSNILETLKHFHQLLGISI
jgi:methylmalonyl-CoA mutase